MKVITIIGAEQVVQTSALAFGKVDLVIEGTDKTSISDGYHTFDELYDHRITLYIALAKQITHQPYCDDNKFGVWKSKLHSDGSSFDGWFVLGIGKEKGKQITYHIPLGYWCVTDFAEELEKAPDFDGHSSQDVIARISQL